MTADTKVFPNPQATVSLDGEFPSQEAFDFHKKLPGYQQSPLIETPSIAVTLADYKKLVEPKVTEII